MTSLQCTYSYVKLIYTIVMKVAEDQQIPRLACRFIPVFLLEALGCPPRANANGNKLHS